MSDVTLSFGIDTSAGDASLTEFLGLINRFNSNLDALLRSGGSAAGKGVGVSMAQGFESASDELITRARVAGVKAGKTMTAAYCVTTSDGLKVAVKAAGDSFDEIVASAREGASKVNAALATSGKASIEDIKANHRVSKALRDEEIASIAAAAKAAQAAQAAAAKAHLDDIKVNHRVAKALRDEEIASIAAAAKAAQAAQAAAAKAHLDDIKVNHRVAKALRDDEIASIAAAAKAAQVAQLGLFSSMSKGYASSLGVSASLQDLKETTSVFRSASIAASDLATGVVRSGAAASGARAHFEGFNATMRDGHSAMRGMLGSMNQMWLTWGAIAPLLAGAAVGSAITQTLKQGKELEYQLVFIKELAGGAAVTFDQFASAVRGSMFAPLEAAQGMRALAQSGLDAQQALYAIPSILKLATVGELTVAEAAYGATGVMHAFNLEVTDLGRIGDVFAKAAAVSNTSVKGMVESMKQASTVGDMYNVTLEQTAAVLATMAKRNIDGSAAGTAFRNMMKELAAPTDKAKAAMHSLGMELYNGSNQLKPFKDMLGELAAKVASLNEKGRITFLNDMFGERGAKAINALLSDYDEFGKILGQLENKHSNFVNNVVGSLEQTVSGKIKVMLNELSLSFDQAFGGSDAAIKRTIETLTDLFKSNEFKSGVQAITNAVANLTTFIAEHITAIGSLVAAYTGAKVIGALVGTFATIAEGGGLAAAAIGGLKTAFASLAAAQTFGGMVSAAFASAGTASLALAAGIESVVVAAGAFMATPLGITLGVLTAAVGLFAYNNHESAKAMDAARVAADEYTKSSEGFGAALKRETAELEKNVTALERQLALKLQGKNPALGTAATAVDTARSDVGSLQSAVDDLIEMRTAYIQAERAGDNFFTALGTRYSVAGFDFGKSTTQLAAFSEKLAEAKANLEETSNAYTRSSELMQRQDTASGLSKLVNDIRAFERDMAKARDNGNARAGDLIIGAEGLASWVEQVKRTPSDLQKVQDQFAAIKEYANKSVLVDYKGVDRNGPQIDTARIQAVKQAFDEEKNYAKVTYDSEVAYADQMYKARLISAEQFAAMRNEAEINYRSVMKAAGETASAQLIAIEGKTSRESIAIKARTTDAALAEEARLQAARDRASQSAQILNASIASAGSAERLYQETIKQTIPTLENKAELDLRDAQAKAASLTMSERARVAMQAELAVEKESVTAKVKLEAEIAKLQETQDKNFEAMYAGTITTDKFIEQDKILTTESEKLRYALDLIVGSLGRHKAASAKSAVAAYDLSRAWSTGAAIAYRKYVDDATNAAAAAQSLFSNLYKGMEDMIYNWLDTGEWSSKSFVDNIEKELKRLAAKQIVVEIIGLFSGAGGSGGSSWLSYLGMVAAAYNGATDNGGASGGSGTKYGNLGSTASMAGSAYQAYLGYTTGYGTGIGGSVGSWAGGTGMYGGYAANSAGIAATNAAAGTTATEAAIDAGALGGANTGATGLSSSSSGLGSIAWIAAIIAGMYMSGEAWQSGNPNYRIKNYNEKDGYQGSHGVYDYNTTAKFKGLYDLDKAIWGEGWADSKLRAVLTGDSLHLQMQEAIFGGGWNPTGKAYLSGSSKYDGLSNLQLGVGLHQEGGWFHSDKNRIDWSKADDNLTSTVTTMHEVITDSFAMLAATFEDTTLLDSVKGFTQDFNIEITDEMKKSGTAFIKGVGDYFTTALVDSLLPSIKELSKEGESTSDTFARLVGELRNMSGLYKIMGKTLTGSVGDLFAMADDLANQFGSSDAMNNALNSYYGKFYSDAERTQHVWDMLGAGFSDLGLEMPTTIEGFRALAEGLDLTTAEGRKTFAGLIGLSDTFASVATNAEAATAKMIGFDASGFSSMIMEAAFNPAEGKSSAESFAAALNQSVREALIGSVVGAVAQNIFTSVVVPVMAGSAVSKATIDDVVAHAQAAIGSMSTLLANLDLSPITSAVGAILPSISALSTVNQSYSVQRAEQRAVAEAVSKVKSEWQSVADAIRGVIAELRGDILSDSQNFAMKQSEFAIATAQARAGDLSAGQKLPELAKALVDMGKAVTSTAVDQALLTATTIASLNATLGVIKTKYGISVPSFAVGTNYVPGDMLANIHEGERIVPAADNRELIGSLNSMADVVQELVSLRREVAQLRAESSSRGDAVAGHTYRISKTLDRVMPDGDAIAVRVAV